MESQTLPQNWERERWREKYLEKNSCSQVCTVQTYTLTCKSAVFLQQRFGTGRLNWRVLPALQTSMLTCLMEANKRSETSAVSTLDYDIYTCIWTQGCKTHTRNCIYAHLYMWACACVPELPAAVPMAQPPKLDAGRAAGRGKQQQGGCSGSPACSSFSVPAQMEM